jgi:glyoxylase I family protein
MSNPLAVRGLHHVARLTKRLDESRAFYREVLGFVEIPRPGFNFEGAWLLLHGLQLHLIVDRSIPDGEGAIQTRDNHLAFEVDDIEAAERRLQDLKLSYKLNAQANTGVKQIFFRDPDGHHVEIASYGPTKMVGHW